MTTFNPKKPEFKAMVDALKAHGYHPFDLVALTTLHAAVKSVANSEKGDPVEAVLMDGPPGVGKTYLAQVYAQVWDAKYIEYNCHPDSTSEELVRDINLKPIIEGQAGLLSKQLTKQELYLIGAVYNAVLESQNGPVVLTIDELDKARNAVDALLLGFLNSGYLSLQGEGEDNGVERIYANLNNLVVFITKNDERDLHGALLRRSRVVYTQYPPENIEKQMLISKVNGLGEEAAKSLVTKANSLRSNTNIRKKPSPPELMRLAKDFVRIAQEMIEQGQTDDGRYTCNIPRTVLNQWFINGLLASETDQPSGKKVLREKSVGTAFLSAVLRGLGKNAKIRYTSVDDIRK